MRPFAALGRRGQFGRLAHLARAALAQYDLVVARLVPLAHAYNTTFRVEDMAGNRYVLHINRPGYHTLEQVQSEMIWLAALRRDTDLVVPEPVPTRAGALVTLAAAPGVPEARICGLLRWVEGRFLRAGLTPRHLEQVGRLAAQLQNHAASFQPPAGFTRPLLDQVDDALLASATRLVATVRPPDDVALARAVVLRIQEALDRLGQTPATYGLIHADLHQWNYLFHHGAIRLIDFDDCGYAHFLFDLGITIYEMEAHPRFPALRAALLAGYSALRPLPPHPEAILSAFVALRGLQNLLWDIEWRDDFLIRDRWDALVTARLAPLRAYMQET